MSELLPCPFCAGKAEFNQTEDGGHFIECTVCRSSTSLRYSLMDDAKPILAEGWNRRAQLAAPVAAQEPAGWRDFIVQLSHAEGGMLNGNRISRTAKELLAAAQGEGA